MAHRFLGRIHGGLPFLQLIAKACGATVVERRPAPMGAMSGRTFANPDGSPLSESQKRYLRRCMSDNQVHRYCPESETATQ